MKPEIKVIEETVEILAKRDGRKCQRCGEVGYLTVDHIIPMAVLGLFGIERRESYKMYSALQLLCRPCNAMKRDRIDWLNPKSKKILLALLAKIK